MKRIAIFAALALAGCGVVGPANLLPPSPSAVANTTVLDEQAALAAELAYKGARIAVETAVDAGVIKGAAAARVQALDSTAFSALGKVRAAYRAGNASSYGVALTEARTAIGALLALTGKTGV